VNRRVLFWLLVFVAGLTYTALYIERQPGVSGVAAFVTGWAIVLCSASWGDR
jgi:hypothetical protein